MSDLINPGLVLLDRDLGESTESVIRALAATVHREGRASTADSLAADALAREAKNATGIPGGIGIPHCRSEAVTQATRVMARLAPAVDFGAKDGPADIVFFIAAPAGADQEHLKLLSKLARSLMKKPFVASLRAAQSPEEVVDIVDTARGHGILRRDRCRRVRCHGNRRCRCRRSRSWCERCDRGVERRDAGTHRNARAADRIRDVDGAR